MTVERVLILGAAGRDFHCFNTYFRDNPHYEVIAFTATQIPGIADRRYPPALSGSRYADGIPIYPEDHLETLILAVSASTKSCLLTAMSRISWSCT